MEAAHGAIAMSGKPDSSPLKRPAHLAVVAGGGRLVSDARRRPGAPGKNSARGGSRTARAAEADPADERPDPIVLRTDRE
jgi:hypothetical protein